jgi:hypothetical protein
MSAAEDVNLNCAHTANSLTLLMRLSLPNSLKSCFYLLLLLLPLLLMCARSVPEKRVKTIEGWLQSLGRDSVLALKEEYSKNGKLLSRHEPLYYCSQEFEYDSLDRVVMRDLVCGETIANGTTAYRYFNNMRDWQEMAGGYMESVQQLLDSKGRIKRTTVLHERHDEYFEMITTDYQYNDRSQLVKASTGTMHYECKEGKGQDDVSYEQQDSLFTYISDSLSGWSIVSPANGELLQRMERTYDSSMHLMKEMQYSGKDILSSASYTYDSDRKLSSKKEESYLAGETKPFTSRTVEYIYSGNELAQIINTTDDAHFTADGRYTVTDTYKNGRLYQRTEKTLSYTETIIYRYTFY